MTTKQRTKAEVKDAKVAAMRRALEFYGNLDSWDKTQVIGTAMKKTTVSKADLDNGRLARVALMSTIGERTADLLDSLMAEHVGVTTLLSALAEAGEDVEANLPENVINALLVLRGRHSRSLLDGRMGG